MAGFPTSLEYEGRVVEQGEAVPVTPGRAVQFLLRVFNPAEDVDGYTVTGMGVAEGCVTAEPPELRLLPHSDGEVVLSLQVPGDPVWPAGEHDAFFRVESALVPAQPQMESVRLAVPEVTDVGLAVSPRSLKGRDRGEFAVEVDNDSNHPVDVGLSAWSEQAGLRVEVEPSRLAVPMWGSDTARLLVEPEDEPAQADQSYPVTVELSADGIERQETVTFVHRGAGGGGGSKVARWLAGLVGLALAVIALLVLLSRCGNGPDGNGTGPTVPAGLPIGRADTGELVRQWQDQLNTVLREGLLVEDAVFGATSEHVTGEFQYLADLPVTGEVDAETWLAMEEVLAGERSLEVEGTLADDCVGASGEPSQGERFASPPRRLAPPVSVADVRSAVNPGFDRVVFEFDDRCPRYEVDVEPLGSGTAVRVRLFNVEAGVDSVRLLGPPLLTVLDVEPVDQVGYVHVWQIDTVVDTVAVTELADNSLLILDFSFL